LVALSGCETGKNEVRAGDDPVSISTAFLHSGASSLLVSLWRVEDEATSVLMKTFYAKWIGEGKSKSQALRETKIEMASGRFSHPRQWAAFILIGAP
ncbi:MAG: CHAT domain-containing protein, partial [Planctomycetes bacterium]|nr:CHAT domain-containing protein [Planctomycetota bacterium]